jgi:hypothetical protein
MPGLFSLPPKAKPAGIELECATAHSSVAKREEVLAAIAPRQPS